MCSLALEDFLLILTAVNLEKKVVFFSSNTALLTSAILTFSSILKPFNYVMPVIYILPTLLSDILDSPVPLIVGINKSIRFKE